MEGPRFKYCSDDCRKEKKRSDFRERYFISVKHTNPAIEKECAQCGERFTSNYYAARRIFCSKACGRRADKAKEDKRDQNGRRRAGRFGIESDPVDTRKVFERDEWRCGICCESIDKEKRFPHPLSPSIDHILPFSESGQHIVENMQAAHLVCNSKKGSREGRRREAS